MSAESIYILLRRGGLSPAGACGVMGNMQAESAMRANNVQDGYGYTDADYTAKVDAGLLDFVVDAIGYGLCQWTYGPRKHKLLDYARSLGKSIGDEAMQVAFCLKELREDYPALFSFLCTCKGIYEAAERVCKEYERPAVDNVAARASYANSFFMTLSGLDIAQDVPQEDTWATTPAGQGTSEESGAGFQEEKLIRALQRGMFGDDVVLLNLMLAMHGYGSMVYEFDQRTENYVKAFQAAHGLSQDGIAGPKTWAALGVQT